MIVVVVFVHFVIVLIVIVAVLLLLLLLLLLLFLLIVFLLLVLPSLPFSFLSSDYILIGNFLFFLFRLISIFPASPFISLYFVSEEKEMT